MRDSDVRAAVRRMLENLHAGDTATRIVEEMGVWSGSVRIDVAVINGQLSGYELKSDRDTLQRLPQQAELYGRVFDCLTLVVGPRHAEKAVSMVPEWWSVAIAFEQRGTFLLEHIRLGSVNPQPDPYLVAQLLWRDEAIQVLDLFGLAHGWRSKSSEKLHRRLSEEVPFAELSEQVRLLLKHRRSWLGKPIGNER